MRSFFRFLLEIKYRLGTKSDRRADQKSRHTKNAKSHVKRNQHQDRMQSKTLPYQVRLCHLAHDRDHRIEYKQPNTACRFPHHKRKDGKRYENHTNAKHGQNVEQCREEGEQKSVADAQQEKTDKKFGKRQQKQQQVS